MSGSSAPAAPETLRWPRLPPALGFLTGMVDVIGWLSLSHFYSANITGDLTQSVSYLLPGETPHMLQILAVPVFFVGLVVAYSLSRTYGADSPATMRALLLVQAAVLLALCFAAGVAGPVIASKAWSDVAVGVLAVLAISLSNTAMHLMNKSAPTTWALTANCVTAAVAILNIVTGHGSAEERDRDARTWRAIVPTVLWFLLGGLLGVLAVRGLHARAWLAPLVTALLLWALLWPRATERAIAGG